MKNKLFDTLKVLSKFSDSEINEILDATKDFSISNDDGNLNININLDHQLPLQLLLNINNFNNESKNIYLNPLISLEKVDLDDLKKCLYHFFNINKCQEILKIFNFINFEISSNNLIIYYHNEFQLNYLTNIREELFKYLNKQLKILTNDIKFILDEKSIEKIKNKIKLEQPIIFVEEQKSKDENLDCITPISDLSLQQGEAIIEGTIFNIHSIKTRNGFIYTYYVTDGNDSISVKKYYTSLQNVFPIKINDYVHLTIKLINDKYDNSSQISGDLKKYKILEKQKKEVNDPPRFELNVHTKMSSYDGLIDLDSLKDFLDENKFTHFAITDRYNVQNFPDVYKKFKNTSIQPIYGVEMEILPEKINAVLNPVNANLEESTYVVFDLETTGLYPFFNDIIEFGAIKIRNNTIVESVQFFIKPNDKLSPKISEITKIYESDLENACSQEEGLNKILNFIGDDILVAHNGIDFDFNFINTKLNQYNLPPLKNCLIDTLFISRSINEGFKSHSLEMISRKLKLSYDLDSAHRADYDAKLLSDVWLEFIKMLDEKNCHNINEINDFIQNKQLRFATRGSFVNVYVKNQEGIRDIYKLVSLSHTDHFSSRPTITWEILNEYHKNLLITNLPIENDVINCALTKTNNQLDEAISKYDFISICPPDGFYHEIKNDNISSEEFHIAINRIIDSANKQNKLVVASSNAYYLTENEKQFHNLYVNIPILNKRNHRFKNYGTGPKMHYRTTEQMLSEFSFLNDSQVINDVVINNPNKILELFNFPITPIKEKLYPPFIPGVNEKIREKVYSNAHKMYGDNLPEIVENRIKKELDSIISHGYAVVYWISYLLVKESIDDGYVVGSRGSVGSSIVATFLNITDVNPLPPHYLCTKCQFSNFEIDSSIEDGYDLPIIKCPKCGADMQGEGHNILFEVFLGFYGDKVPDIDLNFSGDYQNKAHEFIKSMFGKEYTYRAGTISTIAEKTSYANARSYFELIDKEKKYSEIERYATKCVDVKRTTGQHPGGIIVVPSDMTIFDFTPYNFPADDFEQNWYTTHFAFEHIHDNLLKFDILGHDNPTILKILKDLTNVDEKNIPHYDLRTISLFSSNEELNVKSSDILGETTGAYSIPEYGTKFVREMLRDTKPKTFADLIRISGLSHGTDVWIGNAKSLIDNGMGLNEIIACRDDIMSYLIKHNIEPKIAFNIMEDVRKGKKIKEEYNDLLLQNNVPQWYIDSCNKIKYMFPKAHATAYVMHAWKFAWYKLNYPLEYYSAYFTIRTDVFNLELLCTTLDQIRDEYNHINELIRKKEPVTTKQKDLLSIYEVAIEMYARGFKFKMIDVQKSDSRNFVIDYEDKALICPFRTIDGLGDSIANSIVEARKLKEFTNKIDFIERTKVSKQHIKKMEELEILDSLRDSAQINIFDIKF